MLLFMFQAVTLSLPVVSFFVPVSVSVAVFVSLVVSGSITQATVRESQKSDRK